MHFVSIFSGVKIMVRMLFDCRLYDLYFVITMLQTLELSASFTSSDMMRWVMGIADSLMLFGLEGKLIIIVVGRRGMKRHNLVMLMLGLSSEGVAITFDLSFFFFFF